MLARSRASQDCTPAGRAKGSRGTSGARSDAVEFFKDLPACPCACLRWLRGAGRAIEAPARRSAEGTATMRAEQLAHAAASGAGNAAHWQATRCVSQAKRGSICARCLAARRDLAEPTGAKQGRCAGTVGAGRTSWSGADSHLGACRSATCEWCSCAPRGLRPARGPRPAAAPAARARLRTRHTGLRAPGEAARRPSRTMPRRAHASLQVAGTLS